LTIHVGPIETAYIGLNLVTLALTINALLEAYRDRRAVKVLNGRAREVAAHGSVRRERFRVILQALLLLLAVPSVLSEREVTLTPFVAVLMLMSLLLLLSSYMDARERRYLTALVARETRG
jgi:hypothetical protein